MISTQPSTQPISSIQIREATIQPDTPTLPPSEAVVRLISEIQRAGYKSTGETKKLVEFESPSGKIIYMVKTALKENSPKLMVDPRLDFEILTRLNGADKVTNEHRFHSNMIRFPKRVNRGKTKTAYGWQVQMTSVGSLQRFLAALDCTTL